MQPHSNASAPIDAQVAPARPTAGLAITAAARFDMAFCSDIGRENAICATLAGSDMLQGLCLRYEKTHHRALGRGSRP